MIMVDPKTFTLLIVDDEAPLRQALAFDFKRQGFEVLQAESGNSAFDIVCKSKVDLIITDVRMPDGDGIGLLDRVKARAPKIPIVMFVTELADLSADDAYNRGANAVFAKPFDRKALLAVVKMELAGVDPGKVIK